MRRLLCCSAFLLASSVAFGTASAASASYTIAHNTPAFVAKSTKVSEVDANQVIDVVVWLTPANRAALDRIVARQQDKSSAQYHHYLNQAELRSLLAPSDAQVKTVTDFAVSHNLTVVRTDKWNLSVQMRGTVDAVQKAFNTKLANVSFKGRIYRVNMSDPVIADAAGANVMAVQGLDNITFQHHNIAQLSALPGSKPSAASSPALTGGGAGFSNVCFNGTGTQTFTSGGSDPTGTFTGNIYAKNPAGCGYTPPEIQAAYGLTGLYSQGLDGTGQTIAIIDWCGSPTITGDANVFSKRFGLPPLTSSNFAIVDYPASTSCAAPDPEINIDVEWAHAVAPGANIVLVVPPTPTFADTDSALLYIVENHLANVDSNSYGAEELYLASTDLDLQNFIIEVGDSEGITSAFSSGDSGDFTFGYPQYYTPSVSAPADSPYAVAVGGISLSLNSTNVIQWQSGWGTNETLISEPGYVLDPSINFGFAFGAGGGTSAYYGKPSYQSMLPGKYRKMPDIAWLADPFTGGVIAISESGIGSPVYTVYGGTSLACPMFAGLWAIANQAAGGSVGWANPTLYGSASSAITDIVPVGSSTNVTGLIMNGSSKTHESAAMLASPISGNPTFVSGVWNYPFEPGLAYVITFGMDGSLHTKAGWDDVTGLGVANPSALISSVMTQTAAQR